MRLIPFIGVLIFLKPLLIHKSITAMLVLTNGMIYHGLSTYQNENTHFMKILQYNDIITNIFILIYSIYNTPQYSFYAIFGSTNFIINKFISQYLLKKKTINDIINNTKIIKHCDFDNIFHVLFVQYPLFIGLEKILNN